MITSGTLRHGATYEDNGEYVVIQGHCVFTGTFYKCRVLSEGFNKWLGGELIQVALPDATLDEREFLISISPSGWETLPKEE